jgi:hypothetical protein
VQPHREDLRVVVAVAASERVVLLQHRHIRNKEHVA